MMKLTQPLVLALAFASFACSAPPPPAVTPTTPPPAHPTPNAPPAAPAPAAPAAPAPAAAAVDVCALITQAEVKEAVGADVNPGEAQAASGSYLGACNFFSMGLKKVINVSARPIGEWDGTIAAYKDLVAVPGVGEAAHHSAKLGLMVKPAGKPYFLQVMIQPGNELALVTKVAQKAL